MNNKVENFVESDLISSHPSTTICITVRAKLFEEAERASCETYGQEA